MRQRWDLIRSYWYGSLRADRLMLFASPVIVGLYVWAWLGQWSSLAGSIVTFLVAFDLMWWMLIGRDIRRLRREISTLCGDKIKNSEQSG